MFQKKNYKNGSKKTSGAGSFRIKKITAQYYNMTKNSDLFNYLLGTRGNNIDIKLQESASSNAVDTFEVKLEAITPLLIGGTNVYDPQKPDRMNIKNGLGNYVIPGSSLKGVIRQQCTKISRYFNSQDIICEIFGSDDSNKPKAGRVFINDFDLNNVRDNVISNRIHIDKYTASVMEGALVEEEPIFGEFTLKLMYKKTGNKKTDKKAVGLLILALKDLADGSLSIGSGYSIGRGRFKGTKIILNNTTIIDYDTNDNNKALEYIEALKA